MTDLWNNIIYESSLIEKILEYMSKKKKEMKTEKNEEENKS